MMEDLHRMKKSKPAKKSTLARTRCVDTLNMNKIADGPTKG